MLNDIILRFETEFTDFRGNQTTQRVNKQRV